MKQMVRMIVYQSVVFLKQPLTLVSLLLYVGLYFYRSYEDFSVLNSSTTAVYYFVVALYNNGGLPLLLLTLNGLPAVQFVCDEWNSGAILYHLNRQSLWRYVVGTFAKVLLLSGVFYLMATGILVVAFATRFPFVLDRDSVAFQQFVVGYGNTTWLLKDGHVALYYAVVLLFQWWSRAIIYLFTICMSLYVSNRYVIVTIPSIIWTLSGVLGAMTPLKTSFLILFSERLTFHSMRAWTHYYILMVVISVGVMFLSVAWFGFGLQNKIRSGAVFGKGNQVW